MRLCDFETLAMKPAEDFEIWAFQRAQEIVLRQGVDLMQAAQWLDKKGTLKTSQQLRDAICQSLIEAARLQSGVLPVANENPAPATSAKSVTA